MRRASRSTTARAAASSGSTSKVPRGAWIRWGVTLRLPPVGAPDGNAGPPARRNRSASLRLRLPRVGAPDGNAGPPARRNRSASLRSPLRGDVLQEGVGGGLLPQRGEAHVPGVHAGLGRQLLQQ